MTSNTTSASYFLIPATSGLCIQPQDGSIQTSNLNGEQSQQWFIEHSANSDGKIAFKNVETGQYLRATKGRVTVGEKHFWSIHLSTNTPNAFRIQFDSRQFLCNMYGKFTVDNLIHLVLDSPGDLQPTLWYICEFHSWKNSENWPITRPKPSSPSCSSSSSERDDAAKKDLSLKQDQQLIQREKTIEQKENLLQQKEILLQQKLLQAELREREALEFEQEAKIKLEEVDEKEQELAAEKLALKKNKNKNKHKGTTSSIPTHDAENGDDDENPTNETNENNQWLLRFSNLQQRLEIAYREIEGLRRPVFPAATKTTTTTTTATTTANGDDNNDNDNNDNDNNDNENNNNDNGDNDDSNENSSSIITSLQQELKLTKENAQKQKEENIFLWEKLKIFDEQNVSSERNVSSLRRRGIRDNLEEVSSVGNRWAPLNFRAERMRRRGEEEGMVGSMKTRGSRRGREGEGKEEGIGMIEMQKEFKFLERLR